MTARKTPERDAKRGAIAQDHAKSSTQAEEAPNRVASLRPGGTDHASTRTQTGGGGGRGTGNGAEGGTPTEAQARISRGAAVPDGEQPRFRRDDPIAGAPDQRPGAEGGQGDAGQASAETIAAAKAASVRLSDLRAQRLESPPGPEAFRADCLAFNLGDGPFAYVGAWLTDYCWREGSKHEQRQSRSNRRKTLLFYAGDTLVAFGAWRIRQEEVEARKVGEVRYLAVIPSHRRRGIASVVWATVRAAIITSEESAGEETLVRIDVDKENHEARAVYEHWGFELAHSYTSDGHTYDVLYLRPPTEG